MSPEYPPIFFGEPKETHLWVDAVHIGENQCPAHPDSGKSEKLECAECVERLPYLKGAQ